VSQQTMIKKTSCAFCANHCAVLVHVTHGKITKIEPNRDHPTSRGHVCERVGYATKWLYHKDQLKYPLKRAGERGGGQWQKMTWDQALDEIAGYLGKMKEEHGSEALAVMEGTYRANPFWPRARFLSLFGNPQNVSHAGIICFLNDCAMDQATIGDDVGAFQEIGKTNCAVFWGQNPVHSFPRTMFSVRRRQESGGLKIIVIDPRFTETAKLADIHLQIRPGTDCALAMGWINIIINERLYDSEFVERWTFGFDELSERAKEYPPEKVSIITGVPTNSIIESARVYATSKPACLFRGVAGDQFGLNSCRVEQARVALRALTGNIDVPGGDLLHEPGPVVGDRMLIRECQLQLAEQISPSQRQRQLGADRFRLMTWPGYELTSKRYEEVYGLPSPIMHRMGVNPTVLWHAILEEKPYPIKAIITWGSNPLMWSPNTKLAHQALKSPNLGLHVVSEFWLTPTAQLADYVLPAASWLERPLCSTFEDMASVVFAGERPITPLGERRDEYEFWRELGVRLGQEDHWPWKTQEEVIEHRLKPLGMSYEEFVNRGCVAGARRYRKYETMGFLTPSKRVELYSIILEKGGYDPLPYYEEPPESPIRTPELTKEYPLILTTGGRTMPLFHSEHRQKGIGMRERHPDPLVDIHPDTALTLGISDGNWVFIETRRGKIKQKARVTEDILPNVVNAEASWWFPEMPGEEPSLHGLWESNANVLTIDDLELCDPITGGWCNRGLLCKVYKAT